MAFSLTKEQQAVVDDRGGALLVSAAAGSGKTRVLVERLLGPCDGRGTGHRPLSDHHLHQSRRRRAALAHCGGALRPAGRGSRRPPPAPPVHAGLQGEYLHRPRLLRPVSAGVRPFHRPGPGFQALRRGGGGGADAARPQRRAGAALRGPGRGQRFCPAGGYHVRRAG